MMNKFVIAAIVCLGLGCDKISMPHIVWGKQKKTQTEEPKVPELLPDLNGVEFTFDDGPDLAKTPKVLDTLKKYKLKATFFVEGINLVGESEAANERRALLKRMIAEGHIIGNHTFDHKDLCHIPQVAAEREIDVTSKLILDITGQKVTVIRPPYGKKCRTLTKLLNARGLTPIFWDIDPREWQRNETTHQFKTANEIVIDVMNQFNALHTERGLKHMVVIFHDTKSVTVEALPMLLDKLANTPNTNK